MKGTQQPVLRWIGVLGVAAVLGLTAGTWTPATAGPLAQQNTASITIRKEVVDTAGNVVANASLANNVFTLDGPNGFTETQRTGVPGAVSFQNLAPGSYTVTETPADGFTFVEMVLNGVSAPNGSTLTLDPGSQLEITARNRSAAVGAATTGTVNITKSIVDANGAVVAGADRSGVRFGFGLLQMGTVRSPDFGSPTTAAGTVSMTLAPGAYRLFEQAATGCTVHKVLVGSVLFGGPTLQLTGTASNVEVTISSGQTIAIEVKNTCGTSSGASSGAGMATAAGSTRTDQLFPGCNNVTLTFPANTPLRTVGQGVSSGAELQSIFRLNNQTGRFQGFSPSAPDLANDYTMVGARLETVFICVRSRGTLTQPEV